jgi:glycosyltransferase involved in cell wall biosynthesis
MAMQMNCPLIATDSVGLHDYLQHGHSAVLVEPKRVDALVEAIRQGLDDPDTMRVYGERAREFALQHCGEHVTIDYFERVLTEFEVDGRFSKS